MGPVSLHSPVLEEVPEGKDEEQVASPGMTVLYVKKIGVLHIYDFIYLKPTLLQMLISSC